MTHKFSHYVKGKLKTNKTNFSKNKYDIFLETLNTTDDIPTIEFIAEEIKTINSIKRINYNIRNFEDVKDYYKIRSLQLMMDDFEFISLTDNNKYCVAVYKKADKLFHSIYIYYQYRGLGVYEEAVNRLGDVTIVTSHNCDLVGYLRHKGIKYVEALHHTLFPSYKLIENFYNNDRANRSGVFKMNHIDEGLVILKLIGASHDAMNAYCLHPIFQADEPLVNIGMKYNSLSAKEIVLSMEYRSVANAYLSKREITELSEIKLSPLKDVNDMLIADKIQNRKDFDIHHKNHIRYSELDHYFSNWFEKLGITNKTYNEYCDIITI